MSASKVYFTDMRCPVGTGLLDKLKKLIEKAGIDSIDMDNKFVAIKIHFGEPGNLSFLRPNFAKVVADKVTSLGGRPFLTDCNTLYVGRRKHALEHLAAAQENGFSPLSTGCQMIIADGLKGTDEMEVPLEGCDHFQSAFIGRAIMDADIFISLTHFKGHELTGFGGAIKNIGMGCGSRAGKMAMHSIGKPSIDAVNAAPAISTSVLGQCAREHNDHFTDIHPSTNWRSQIEHAQKIGIGNMDYELVTVK